MRCILRFRLNLLAFAAIALPAVLAQDSGKHAVSGVVRDVSGVRVAGAEVLLTTVSNETALSTTTDREGKFSLACDKPGSYTLRVRKEGFRDSGQAVTSSSTVVQVVLSRLPAASTAAGSAMLFDDNAGFTVAGITDWTAAGGHGSDPNLRASESLARDARGLGNRDLQRPVDAAHSETVLRATLSR
jgi:carboxypeptidase family protein